MWAVAKTIWHCLRNHGKPLLVDICRGFESFQGRVGGAKWILSIHTIFAKAGSGFGKGPQLETSGFSFGTLFQIPCFLEENFRFRASNVQLQPTCVKFPLTHQKAHLDPQKLLQRTGHPHFRGGWLPVSTGRSLGFQALGLPFGSSQLPGSEACGE